MGVSLSLACIILCISCIFVRKKCLKSRSFNRSALASNNYHPAVAHYASEGSSVQVRLENPCSAEMHEIEHLVNEDPITHIPASAPIHLDTKVKYYHILNCFVYGVFIGSGRFAEWAY